MPYMEAPNLLPSLIAFAVTQAGAGVQPGTALALLEPQPGPGRPAAGSPPLPAPRTPPRQVGGSISDADYPAAAIAAGEQGTVRVRISIDRAGRVAGCEVTESSGSAALDSASCSLIQERFTYEPARNARGEAVPAGISRRITWRSPGGAAAPSPFESFGVIITATLRGGAIEGCALEAIEARSQASPLPPSECSRMFASLLVWAAQQPDVTSITQVVAFTREGDQAPVLRPAWGSALIRAEADLTIAPDGTNAVCAPTRMESAVEAGAVRPADPCSLTGGARTPMFAPDASGTPRRGRSLIATFVQRAAPPAR